MSALNVFERAYNAVEETIEYNPSWANGTGYFDWAADGKNAPQLKLGQVVKSIDTSGRRIIIIGAGGIRGNVVVFDRFKPDHEGRGYDNGPRVVNINRELRKLGLFPTQGGVSEETMILLVGSWGSVVTENIGFFIKNLVSTILKQEEGKE